jgi:hypothetical protein
MAKSVQQRMFKELTCWQQSGLTHKDWCEKNKLAYGAFHYWYRRYRAEEPCAYKDHVGDRFVPLMIDSSQASTGWCELLLNDGKKLVFHEPVNAEFLKKDR